MFVFANELYELSSGKDNQQTVYISRSNMAAKSGRLDSGVDSFNHGDPDPCLDFRSLGNIDLEEKANELGIKYFLMSYCPLNADTRVSLIPKRAIKSVQKNGCGIPAAMYFKADGADPEMYLYPDTRTLVQLPWKREYAWLSCNLYMGGEPFKQCPRTALITQCERLREKGFVMRSGIEPEFMLLNKDGTELGDKLDVRQPMSLQEPLATLRTAPLMTRITDAMEELGWDPYEIDHEATCCQYEINFGFFNALTLADRHSFMKFMIKELAELEGYTATFMPIPLPNLLCANGLHVNLSLWNVGDNTNAFKDPTDKALGISKTAYHFLGGMKEHARACCALMCPTVNSYKRLNAGSWCPNTVSWGGNNRTVLFRVPADNRIEHRLADGSTNPYLTQTAIIASGLDGLDNETDPGRRCDTLIEDFPEKLEMMPKNLQDALQTLNDDKYLVNAMGHELIEGFTYLKSKEWQSYMGFLTKWEQDYYINC